MKRHNRIVILNHESDVPKYQQLINSINTAIAKNWLQLGDVLPSVNNICNAHNLSRDTVFKAYSILKEQNVIDSVPNKGYYVASKTRKVLLVLDTFKAYKEVLYHSFIKNLPENIITDVQFHHYNIENFKTIINNSKGKYYKYIVMGFDNKDVPLTLDKLNNEKLLLIDWNIHANPKNNFVVQDFGQSFFSCLEEITEDFRKYKGIYFLYPDFTDHPIETVNYFTSYCEKHDFNFEIITSQEKFKVRKNIAYISVSDRMLGEFLEQCKSKKYKPGKEIGILSYNETPMKKFIHRGITVVSTNFGELGEKAAEFVSKDQTMQCYIPTCIIKRTSL